MSTYSLMTTAVCVADGMEVDVLQLGLIEARNDIHAEEVAKAYAVKMFPAERGFSDIRYNFSRTMFTEGFIDTLWDKIPLQPGG